MMRQWITLLEGQATQPQSVEIDGVLRPIHNSEGALIADTREAQVAFWRWFGKSKILDENGRPLVVFRGDKPGKSAFTGREDPSNLIQGNIFFSSERAVAKGYTPHRTNSYISANDMNQSHGLYSTYLKITKPVIIDAKGEDWSAVPLSGSLKKNIGWPAMQIDDIALYVQQKTSNDGLIVRNVYDQFGDGDQFVVFSPQQIKMV